MNNWQTKNLKDISESIQYGFTESSTLNEVGPKFLRITDIQDYKVNWRNVPFCKIDDKIKSKYLLKDGDLLFARTGATVGKSFLIKGEIPESVFASYLIRVRVKQGLFDKYLSNFFNSPQYWSQITEGQVGIGQPNVNGTKLGQLQIPLPDLTTQQAIVSKIEELFSDLDKGIEDLKKAQQQLKTFRQSVLKWAFEGKLTNENVKEGKLPKGWVVKKVSEIALKVTDGEHSTPKRTSSGFYLLSARNIQNGFITLKDVDYVSSDEYHRITKRCLPQENDILISCSGSIGRVCRVPKGLEFGMVRSVALIKCDWKKYDSKYFEFLFQSSILQKQIEKGKKATAQANLFLGPINNLELTLCPLEEQQRIVQEIESRLSVADKMEEGIAESLQKAESLRQSILKKAFSGELV